MIGPGTELKRLLRLMWITSNGECQCDQRAMLMDEEGPEWCRKHLDVIVNWLREEANSRGLPFVETAVRLLVKQAIRNAERKMRMTS